MSAFSKIPDLPAIEDFNLYIEVLSHKDLNSTPSSEWGDNDRLAELGEQVLNHVVTLHLFSKHPLVRAEELRTFREHHTSHSNLNNWLDSYQLKQRLRIPADQRDAVCSDQKQMAAFFHSYVAAVLLTKGFPVVQTWISKLIDPDANPRQLSAGLSTLSASTTSSSASSSSTSAASSLTVPVSLVNEFAMRKGLHINYVASQEGQSHQPTWTVRCLINNVEKGQGVGSTQKVAKEEAARQAWVAMGW